MKDRINEYADALKSGREIVVVSNDEDENSAIWYMRGDTLYTFSVYIGNFRRDDWTAKTAAEKIVMLEKQGCSIFVRGLPY